MTDRHGPLVLAANLAGSLLIAVLVVWLITTYAGQPGPRPDQGPPRGAIPTPAAYSPTRETP